MAVSGSIRIVRYVVAVVLIGIAFGVRYALKEALGNMLPFTIFIPAVLLAAWYGRLGPGVVALVLGWLLGDYYFLAPVGQFAPYGTAEFTNLVVYAFTGVVGISIIQTLDRTQTHRRLLEREIRERAQAEAALRFTQFAVDHSADAAFWMGPDARLIYVNEAACASLGYTREELLKMTVHDIDPDFPPSVWAEHWRELKVRKSFMITSHHKAKGGRVFPVEIKVNYVQFGGREVNCAFVRDISEQRRAEEQLRAAQRELQAYADALEKRVAERTKTLAETVESLEGVLYHVAHDLRAPLRAMHSFTELLLTRYAPKLDEAGEDYVRRIWEASEKADRLILDLLDYGRLGHQKVSLTRVDLEELLDQLVLALEPEIEAKQGEVRIDKPVPDVAGAVQTLQQVLVNLLENALKFVAPGASPRIHIWAERVNSEVRLNIQDNGIGIAPEYHQKIFGVFERLHSEEAYPGTGIGLAIARKGIEKLGGQIGVESAPGKGSRFWLLLRAAPAS